MEWLITTLAVVLAGLIPYTHGMQETTLMLGRKLSDEMLSEVTSVPPERIKRRGLQDELTPRAQNLRNVLMWGLMIALFGLTTYAFAWYHGLWVLVVTVMTGVVFFVIFGFPPGHPRYAAEIRADMQRRVVLFATDGGDSGRSAGMLFLIGRFDNLVKELERSGKEPSLTRFQIMYTRLLFHFGFLQSSELQNAHVLRYKEEQGYQRGYRAAFWTIRIALPLVVAGGVALVVWMIYSLIVYLGH